MIRQVPLEMNNHAFWLDEVPFFFYGGEVHYFRIDPGQWESRLEQVRELGITTVSTYVPWIWHEFLPKRFDFTGKTHPQRNVTRFVELCQAVGLTVFIRPGPYVMAELRQEGIPGWLIDENPDVLAQNVDGHVHPARMVNYLHPTFLALAHRWYRAVGHALAPYFRQNGGPIIMSQLDNEVGMLHWVTGISDHHPSIRETYDISPQQSLAVADDGYWRASMFWRHYRAQYLRGLAEEARKLNFPGPFVINVHGFRDFSANSRGVDYPVGLSQLMDTPSIPGTFLGGDFYPGHVTIDNFHDLLLAVSYTRAVNSPHSASFSPEFQSGRAKDRPHVGPSDFELAARVSIAGGLNGLNWYMLSAGENPEDIGIFGRRHDWQAPIRVDGSLDDSASAVRHLGALLTNFGSSLVQSEPVADIHVGFYSPYYMTETAAYSATELERAMIQEVSLERERFHFDGIYRNLLAANIGVSMVVVDASGDPLDPAQYPALWIATTRYMDKLTQSRLAEYVTSGGMLILGPRIPEMDWAGRPCRVLSEQLDLSRPTREGTRGLATIVSWESVFCPIYTTFAKKPGAEVLGILTSQGRTDPVIVHESVQRGQVVLMGAGLSGDYDYYGAVLQTLVARLGLGPSLHSSNSKIHASRREGPAGHFLFVENFRDSDQTATVSIVEDGVARSWEIDVAARHGLMLPYGGVPLIPDVLAVVSTTAEITLNALDTLTIHRGRGLGMARLKWMAGTSPYPTMHVKSGQAAISLEGNEVTVKWGSASPGAPVIKLGWDLARRARNHPHSRV